MRDVGWGFFYGWVNFDNVFGTTNHYKTVDVFAGTYNANYKKSERGSAPELSNGTGSCDFRRHVGRLDECLF
ncbi:hypothetical protein ACFS07_33600 [Undibacterium arcticum]